MKTQNYKRMSVACVASCLVVWVVISLSWTPGSAPVLNSVSYSATDDVQYVTPQELLKEIEAKANIAVLDADSLIPTTRHYQGGDEGCLSPTDPGESSEGQDDCCLLRLPRRRVGEVPCPSVDQGRPLASQHQGSQGGLVQVA